MSKEQAILAVSPRIAARLVNLLTRGWQHDRINGSNFRAATITQVDVDNYNMSAEDFKVKYYDALREVA